MTETVNSLLQNIKMLLDEGRLNDAKVAYTKLPFAEFQTESELQNLGVLGLRMRFFKATQQVFERGVQLFPKQHLFWNNLGTSLLELGELESAKQKFEQALELCSDYTLSKFNLGMCFDQLGQLEKAKEFYLQVVADEPKSFLGYIRLALVSERQVKSEDVILYAEKAWELNKDHPDVYYVRAFQFLNQKQPEQALESIEVCIEKQPGNVSYHFLRVKILERLEYFKDVPTALDHANELARPENKAKLKAVDDHGHMMKFLDSMETSPKQKKHKQGLLFVLGCPRSGTSLLSQMLGGHSKVQNFGELNHLELVYQEAIKVLGCGDDMTRLMDELWVKDNQQLLNHLRSYYESLVMALPDLKEGCFWLDKGIMNTFYYPLLAKLLPGAPVIFLVRDGRETAVSIYKQNFKEQYWFKYSLADAMLHWQQTTEWVPACGEKLDAPFYQLRYEDLVIRPKEKLEDILEFLGLPWDDACLEFSSDSKAVLTASYSQVKKSLYTTGVSWAKDHYPKWHTDLTKLASESLKKMGY